MGKRRQTPGTRQFNCEMDESLFDQFEAFATDRGESKRHVVETALRRHMAYPPPKPVEPPIMPLPQNGKHKKK